MFTTPTVVGGTLYVGSCAGVFYAFDAATGEVRWSFDTGDDGSPAQFHGNPIVTGELVVTPSDATDEGYTYAFDRATGELSWKQATDGGGGIVTDLLHVGSTAVGVSKSGDLLCFGLADGLVLWSFSPEAYTYREFRPMGPALAGGRILFSGLDGAVYAVDAESGEKLWKRELGARITTALRVDGDGVFLGLADFRLVRLKLADGWPAWELPLDGAPAGFPLVAGDTLVVLLGLEFKALDVLAVDADRGVERWRQSTETSWSTVRLYPWHGAVLAGTGEGELHAFQLSDGSEEWTLTLEGRLRGMGSAGGLLYVGTIDGMLYALGD